MINFLQLFVVYYHSLFYCLHILLNDKFSVIQVWDRLEFDHYWMVWYLHFCILNRLIHYFNNVLLYWKGFEKNNSKWILSIQVEYFNFKVRIYVSHINEALKSDRKKKFESVFLPSLNAWTFYKFFLLLYIILFFSL